MRTVLVDDSGDAGSDVRGAIRDTLRRASRELEVGAGEVVVRIVTPEGMRQLNGRWRGRDEATDVLSFPMDAVDPEGARHIGDIALCLAAAGDQARRRRHSLAREASLLALHGLLHLLGYDHDADDGEMDALERRLRRRTLPARS